MFDGIVRTTKICYRCKEEKPIGGFQKDIRYNDGHRSYCGDCRKIIVGEEYIKNGVKKRASSLRWKKNNPAKYRAGNANYRKHNKTKVLAAAKKWVNGNRARVNARRRAINKRYYPHIYAYLKKWNAANPEKSKKYRKRWALKNLDKIRQNCERRRARKKSVVSTFDEKQWKWLNDLCGKRCLKCGATKGIYWDTMTQDHVIPLAPGTDTLDNIQPLCDSCNYSKGRKVVDYRSVEIKLAIRQKMIELGLEPQTNLLDI